MSKSTLKPLSAIICLSLMITLGACAKSQNPDTAQYKSHDIADPIEPVNRFTFGFNDILDRILIEPLAKGYNAVLPQVVRNSIQSFMRNLASPIIAGNQLLQGKVGDAGVTTARFVINSTVGVVGLADVASTQGLNYKNADFGQTLAVWGVGDGFYLVLPILGPSSLRDATGTFADSYADPVRIVADNTDHMWIYYAREGLDGLDTRSRLIKPIDDMRRNSLDYYAAARSAYSQKRESLIRGEKPDTTTGAGPGDTDHP